MALFEIKNLTFSYPEQERMALNSINFKINRGEFISICGKSGCGKSTLLRHLKPVLTPHGNRQGTILFDGEPLCEIDIRTQAQKIGYVLQNPDNQIVTDKVWHELAFGLESLGYDNQTIRLRVAEMASFFGIQSWFLKNVSELSGGQKQLLNLASIMAMQPDVLILDEPTSQLDPIAASDFLETVRRINREIGTTVIITEHRMEDTFPASDRVIVMDDGKILLEDTPKMVGTRLKELKHEMFLSMPSSMQIYAQINNDFACPLTVKDGRCWLSQLAENKPIKYSTIELHDTQTDAETVIELKEVWFKYEREAEDIISGLSVKIPKGKLYCILGGNGTGKTTTLSLISGINKPYRGKVFINGNELSKIKSKDLFRECLGVLPQNPQALFVKKTVKLDLMEMLSQSKMTNVQKDNEILSIAQKVHIEHLLDMHPYDLSGGEQQRAALAKVLLLKPKIILLDEPTKGMDNHFKIEFGNILRTLKKDGATIVMVSHDVEFCSQFADECALFFNGNIVTQGKANAFFSGNSFYTTIANRMSRHIFKNAVTVEDVVNLCNKNQL